MSSELDHLVDRIASLRVLVVGDVILDSYFHGVASRLSQEAPVVIAELCERQNFPGGAGNVAANARSLGAHVTLHSAIGLDFEAECIAAALAAREVNIDHVHQTCQRRTLVKHRVLCGNQIMIRFDQGTTGLLDAETEDRLLTNLSECFVQADAIIVSDYGYGVITPKIIDRLRQLQSEFPRIVTIDSKTPKRFREVCVTAVKPNYEQALRLLNLETNSRQEGIEYIFDSGQKLLDAVGANLSVVTLDSDGSVVLSRNNSPYRICANPIGAPHSSGAGDTFLVGLTLGLALGAPPIQAAQMGAAAAEVVVRKHGTAVCTHQELKASDCDRILPRVPTEIGRIADEYRRMGRSIVLTSGCFDIVHPGHISCLRQAKQLGDILIVGINSDESIKRFKGANRPINCLSDRIAVLEALSYVGHVVPFSEDTPHRLIEAVRPDFFVKGGDYTVDQLPEAALVASLGGKVVIVPFVTGYSSTKIVNRMSLSES